MEFHAVTGFIHSQTKIPIRIGLSIVFFWLLRTPVKLTITVAILKDPKVYSRSRRAVWFKEASENVG